MCIYWTLSFRHAETARAIGKLFLGDINYSVYNTYRNITPRNKVNLKPLGLYIDELSAIITDEFVEILNKCRGAKVEITSAFQTSSDINKISPDLCQQVFENSLNWFVMKQRMDEIASLLSYAIGTNESVKKTVKIEDDQEQNSGSQRAVEELLVHPNVIKNLGVGQCVLFRQQPTQIDLMNVKYIDQETIDRNLSFFENNQLISKRSRNLTLDVGSKPESGGALHD
jgi:conjugal transfer pilus assembly protein TraD